MNAPVWSSRAFLPLWTIATLATVAAFVLHLGLRGKSVSLGYDLGRARAEQDRLREVKRVLQLEAASYKTPERVEIVARTLLGMEPPSSDRIVSMPAVVDPRGPGVAAPAGSTGPTSPVGPAGRDRAAVDAVARDASQDGSQDSKRGVR